MILVDTSVWIDHFRHRLAELVTELRAGSVVTHPFVIGELALGQLRNRTETLQLMADLAGLELETHDAVVSFVHDHRLSGTGIGWVDAHLLCAAASRGASVWTQDVKLRNQAARLGLT